MDYSEWDEAQSKIAVLKAALRKAESERDEARQQRNVASMMRDTERAARESAEQLAVWAVKRDIGLSRIKTDLVGIGIRLHFDGTDAGILAALRRAMEGEK